MHFPTATERRRSGGSGVYYHLVFWGRPRATVVLGAVSPKLMVEELEKSYALGDRTFWILNVGSIKPEEFATQVFMNMAFNVDEFKGRAAIPRFTAKWAKLNFGASAAQRVSTLLGEYYQLAFDRDPEYMARSTTFPETSVRPTKYNGVAFDDELTGRAKAYASIVDAARQVEDRLPAARRATFYEMVRFPIDVSSALALQQLYLDQSVLYGYQHRMSANYYSHRAGEMHAQYLEAFAKYDHLEAGKWDGIVMSDPNDLPAYQAPDLPTWHRAHPHVRRCGIQVDDGGYFDSKGGWWMPTLPTFHPELGRARYYFDVFMEQPGDAKWSVKPLEPWIRVSRTGGTFSQSGVSQARVWVTVDWRRVRGKAAGSIAVSCSASPPASVLRGGKTRFMTVHVNVAKRSAAKVGSFIESEGVISMFAAHATARSAGWAWVPISHTGVGDLQASIHMAPLGAVTSAAMLDRAPCLIFDFVTQAPFRLRSPDLAYAFPGQVYGEHAVIKVYALPTFPIIPHGGVRIAVQVDGGKPVVRNFAAPEFGARWRRGVLRNEAVARINVGRITPGAHVLAVYALDPGVTLDRIEVDFSGSAQHAAIVPETRVNSDAVASVRH